MAMPAHRCDALVESTCNAGAGSYLRKTAPAKVRVRPDAKLGIAGSAHVEAATRDNLVVVDDGEFHWLPGGGQFEPTWRVAVWARLGAKRHADAFMGDHEAIGQDCLDCREPSLRGIEIVPVRDGRLEAAEVTGWYTGKIQSFRPT
jgi:hypothetical protein